MTEKATDARDREVATFSTAVDQLPEAARSGVVEVADGDSFVIEIGPVRKQLGSANLRMLAYNGSIPGPTLKVREGSRVSVPVTNRIDLEMTVHWHGLRLRNEFDGTHETQAPIGTGETFVYELEFPDPGIYWYHPHIREDYAQELGLYGNVLVVPAEEDYWPPVDRELVLTLDDILVEDGAIAPFRVSETTHVAMGRFGNVMLVSGHADTSLTARLGEVVRLYLTNTANTRVFNIAIPGAHLKLVGGDSGHVEREELVEEVLLAPSERVVVDALFAEPGPARLEHRTPSHSYTLVRFAVEYEPFEGGAADSYANLRVNSDLSRERGRIAPYITAPPDKTLAFVAEMELGSTTEGGTYVCPMHPEVTSVSPDRCPKCGMKLIPSALAPAEETDQESAHEAHEGHVHDQGIGGIEWEDDMVEVNRTTTPTNMRWKLVDRSTGAENAAIDWRFLVGDQVKIRLVNEMDSDHPMPHPFHIHGAGRFLILARDEAAEPNLVWKDTVLVRTGETVDILLDVTNPGRWMAHCHIAEHHEGGMMFGFRVDDRG